MKSPTRLSRSTVVPVAAVAGGGGGAGVDCEHPVGERQTLSSNKGSAADNCCCKLHIPADIAGAVS